MIEGTYNLLVNRVPGIRDRYQKKRKMVKGIGRAGVWVYLLGLNIDYYLLRNKKLAQIEKYPYYEQKHLYAEDSESSLSKRKAPELFAKELAEYDVISFDVFDTLIFRPFSEPTDLFFLLGNELGYMDFKRIRCEMEWKAREKKYKREKHYEVTLEEIYTILSRETGLDKEKIMRRETELECAYCFANPYMKQVISQLRKLGKRIIVTSDMYLNMEQIQELLERCGYENFHSYYVSCDHGKSKNKGDLYDYIREREGKELTYVHIGDNYTSDIVQAKNHGMTPVHYVNVNDAGMPYRAEDMSVITGSIYRGMVNAHIHNGLRTYSREYEYGYIYGGLFVCGYCQMIYRFVKQNQIEKILFLARDGDILNKVYRILYPQESNKCEYVYWSRLAAAKMGAPYFKYDYFRRFLHHKVNQNYTLKQILSSMELEDMIHGLCGAVKLNEETKLTDKNIGKVKEYLLSVWEQVLEHYEEQLVAGKQYYTEKLGTSKKAVAVDIGWAGSGAIVLDYIVNHIWEMNCQITGIIAGTNTCHNAEPDASETFLQSGKLVSYLYSQRENRDIWKFHDPGKKHNLYWEMLLDAPMGSFKGFYLDEYRKYRCEFKEANVDAHKIEEIQKGILEFAGEYAKMQEKLGDLAEISGRDAYAPMVLAESKDNQEFMKRIANLMDNMNVG